MQIQQYPSGFLAALNAKSGGYTPSELEDRVRPTIDMLPFYLATLPMQGAADTQAGKSAINTGAEVIVPQGEVWMVVAASAEVVNASAPTVTASVKLNLQPPNTAQAAVTAAYAIGSLTTTNQGVIAGWTPPFPSLFAGGFRFRAYLAQTLSAGTAVAAVRVIYRPLTG